MPEETLCTKVARSSLLRLLCVVPLVLVVIARGATGHESKTAIPNPRLHLIWYDPLCCIPRAFPLIQAEADRIFGKIGVPVTWEKDTMTKGRPEAVNVSVILVGHHKKLPGFDPHVLGSFQPKPRNMGAYKLRQTVLIYLPNILRTMGYPLRDDAIAIDSRILSQVNGPEELCELSRAIGRVIAHEIVHAVSPEIPHTKDGLMCSVASCATLLVGQMSFPPQYEDEFRNDLVAAILSTRVRQKKGQEKKGAGTLFQEK